MTANPLWREVIFSLMIWQRATSVSLLTDGDRYPEDSAKSIEADGHGMRVISQSPDPLARMRTMTERKGKSGTIDVKALLAGDEEFLRTLVRTQQEVLEAEMTEALRRGADGSQQRPGGRPGARFSTPPKVVLLVAVMAVTMLRIRPAAAPRRSP